MIICQENAISLGPKFRTFSSSLKVCVKFVPFVKDQDYKDKGLFLLDNCSKNHDKKIPFMTLEEFNC